MQPPKLMILTLATALGCGLANSAAARQAPVAKPTIVETEDVYYDFVDDAGRLNGGRLMLQIDPFVATRAKNKAAAVDNRIDLVTVGDGYTAAQLSLYATHATNAVNAFLAQQPFSRYRYFYRVTQINVVSNESGVDNDPTLGIMRDTAMDMAFWCTNIERLLCINVSKAYQYASAAPDVDQILAIANSTKYGGAGYTTSELATVAGGNASAAEIAIHEFGHSIGNLTDEYDYADGATYTGGEHPRVNASILTASAMASAGTKWAAWLSVSNAQFDGLVSTYQGCALYQFGLYRPSNNSRMRTLGRPFNLPSVEALIIEMYKIVKPIDDSTPLATVLNGTETVSVTPMPVNGSPALTVQWSVDGVTVAGASGSTLDLSSLCLSAGGGAHVVSVTVRDPTTWVLNEAARDQWMTQSRSWTVQARGCRADVNNSGSVDIDDLVAVINGWGVTSGAADINCDHIVNIDDLVAVITSWGACH